MTTLKSIVSAGAVTALAVCGALAAAPAASADPAPTNPTTLHAGLVDGWYEDVLDRAPSSTAYAGTEYWVAQLDGRPGQPATAVPHADVLRTITRSSESANLDVRNAYQAFLLRSPDAGARYWIDGIRGGMAPEWVEQNVLASPEFAALRGSQRVDVWYGAILGRDDIEPASAGEERYWEGVAARDGALAAVRGIWYSAEGVDRRTYLLFNDLLGRNPNQGEYDYFFSRTAASLAEAEIQIATTPEYEAQHPAQR